METAPSKSQKQHIMIKSAHRSEEVLQFETTTMPNYEKMSRLCNSFFEYNGYLVITWSGGTKICMNQQIYDEYSKHIPNNKTVFYLESSCVKKMI